MTGNKKLHWPGEESKGGLIRVMPAP